MSWKILAYHRISDDPVPGLEAWSVRPTVFRRQMQMLDRLGYRGVPVRDLLDAMGRPNPSSKLIGISFDDGYLDTFESGLPILADLGFTASVYVVPSAIGGTANWELGGAATPLAGWDDLGELVRSGWEIGMHSRSHPARFDLLEGDDLEAEVRCGVSELRQRLATRIESFAYPHGRYSDEAAFTIRAAGYRAAVATEPGDFSSESDLFRLPRYEIKRRDTLAEFTVMLLTGLLPRRRETLRRFRPSRARGAGYSNRSGT